MKTITVLIVNLIIGLATTQFVDTVTIYAMLGFTVAAYSVIANDSVQTLGTWMVSNTDRVKWQYLAFAASSVMLATIWIAWATNGGDISFGRLNKIEYIDVKWYHIAAPMVLLVLTRYGIPVSTSFLVLSTFASTFVLEKMLVKSIMGYALAAIVAYIIWFIVERFINENSNQVTDSHKKYWRIAQWLTTGFLWYTWLSHDIANIAVFLPRNIPMELMIAISVILTIFLTFTFYEGGGEIQKIVINKTGIKYVRAATIVDLVYAFILLYFKQYNDIPMSTTWVFVGLLSGRELAISTVMDNYKLKHVFPVIGKDFIKMMFGLIISVGIVLAISLDKSM